MIGDSVTVDQLLDEKVVYQQALRLLSRSIYGRSYISIDDLDALARCFETLSEPVRTGFLANAHRDLQLAAALAGEIRPSGRPTPARFRPVAPTPRGVTPMTVQTPCPAPLELAEVRDLCVAGTARAVREDSNVSLREFAAHLGVSPSTLSDWERGLQRPTGGRAVRYLDELHKLHRRNGLRPWPAR